MSNRTIINTQKLLKLLDQLLWIKSLSTLNQSNQLKMHKKFTKKKRSEQFNYSPPWKLFRKKAINPLKPLIISLLHSHKVLWTRPNPTSLKGTMKQFKAAKTAEGKAKYLGNLFLDCFWNYCHIIKYEKYFQMVFFSSMLRACFLSKYLRKSRKFYYRRKCWNVLTSTW